MGTITTADGTEIFYKDCGSGQPIVFSHGWPLSGDDWDAVTASLARRSEPTDAGKSAACQRPEKCTRGVARDPSVTGQDQGADCCSADAASTRSLIRPERSRVTLGARNGRMVR